MQNKKIAILTDSCADVPEEYRFKYHIYTVSMLITCQDGEYKDGITIHAEEVYTRLRNGELPKTSTPLGGDIEGMLRFLKEKGYEQVLAVMLSGGLSSTVQAVSLIAENCNIEAYVLDSLSASVGNGAIVIQAAKWRDQGMDFATLCKKVEKLKHHSFVYFSIDTLEYLVKGGRIGKVAGFAGQALNIKPILSFDKDGEIFTPAKVRGSKAVMKKLISLVSEQLEKPENEGKAYSLVVADGGAPEQRDVLEKQMKELFPDYKEFVRAKIGAALSTYVGYGLLGAGIQFFDE